MKERIARLLLQWLPSVGLRSIPLHEIAIAPALLLPCPSLSGVIEAFGPGVCALATVVPASVFVYRYAHLRTQCWCGARRCGRGVGRGVSVDALR